AGNGSTRHPLPTNFGFALDHRAKAFASVRRQLLVLEEKRIVPVARIDPLQENATRISCPHSSQRKRAKPRPP
ncbi:MAG: hypothetical protein ACREQJ_08365, partial [Candidatus Binatia bacterium]